MGLLTDRRPVRWHGGRRRHPAGLDVIVACSLDARLVVARTIVVGDVPIACRAFSRQSEAVASLVLHDAVAHRAATRGKLGLGCKLRAS